MRLAERSAPHASYVRQGFTLIELSIVLVIIGLIIGGVLVGRELIRAAEIRKIISGVESYRTAINTFRLKYNALPGDISNPAQFGLPCTTYRTGDQVSRSDGNGILSSYTIASYDDRMIAGENLWFWKDLKVAGMTGDAVDITTCAFYASFMDTDTEREFLLPRIGNGFLTVYNGWGTGRNGQHFFTYGGITTTSNDGIVSFPGNTPPFEFRLSPTQSSQIDVKTDDGAPLAGKVKVDGGQTGRLGVAPNPAATACITSTTAYNTASSYADSMLCSLEFSAGF